MFESYEQVLLYWFGYVDEKTELHQDGPIVKRWFARDPNVDMEIKDKFESYVIAARKGELTYWTKSLKGLLGMVIVLDQFTRNIYRDQPAAFSGDIEALNITLRTIKQGLDQDLILIHRQFLYLPLMHSENLEIQKMSLEKYSALVKLSKTFDPQNVAYYQYVYGFAQKHFELIEMFGRFPHRNEVLGRRNTPEEQGYLKMTGGSAF